MNDQCKHCMARGDMKVCRDVECFQHENWYAVELEKGISRLQAEVRVLRKYRPEFMNRPLFSDTKP